MLRTPALLFIILLGTLAQSCTPDVDEGPREDVTGLVPIYANPATEKLITGEAPRPTVKPGKIYTVGNLLLQVEQDSGIHVINYANPNNPTKIGFVRSFLCKELAMKNGLVYTNNLSDLVVIDINNINNVREVSRVNGVFPELSLQYPARPSNAGMIYFECPDPSKGVIIGWKEQTIKNPKCRR